MHIDSMCMDANLLTIHAFVMRYDRGCFWSLQVDLVLNVSEEEWSNSEAEESESASESEEEG